MTVVTAKNLSEAPARRGPTEWINPASSVPHSRHCLSSPRHAIARPDLILAACLFVAAIGVRWPLILRGETLLHSDEAIVGLMAQDIAEGRRFPIYFYGQRYMGALEAYVIAAISPLVEDPLIALRLGPALFFAALVAVQFLMLTRWFGRRGGLIGAMALLAAPPMFAQWSISARGGYIEILLIGTLLLWVYDEWFSKCGMPATAGKLLAEGGTEKAEREIVGAQRVSSLRRFAFGLILGIGLWVNPSIVLFLVPIAASELIKRRLPVGQLPFHRLGLATLPLLALAAVLLLNCIWSVHVGHGRVQSQLLLGLLPKPVAALAVVIAVAGFSIVLQRRFDLVARLRGILNRAGPMIAGILIGAAPAVLYAAQAAAGLRKMEPALPLGLRPLWTVGETASYLWHGLPLLFGADARPFLALVTIGRPATLEPLDIMTGGLVAWANWIVLGAVMTAALTFLLAYRGEIGRLLRLQSGRCSPEMLLLIGAAGTVLLFLLSGATHDFNTIRYLIPIWAFLPGLLAVVFTQRQFRLAGAAAPLCLMLAWAIGQYALWMQVGRPHPLRPLADELVSRQIDPAVAEIFDAHLLSYLTRQQCRVAEYEPFWSRLAHYQTAVEQAPSVDYIVLTAAGTEGFETPSWHYPGPPPPEVHRRMWKKLRQRAESGELELIAREPLVSGFELVRAKAPQNSP